MLARGATRLCTPRDTKTLAHSSHCSSSSEQFAFVLNRLAFYVLFTTVGPTHDLSDSPLDLKTGWRDADRTCATSNASRATI